jgi:uncharacterized MAPEG superfamily protein
LPELIWLARVAMPTGLLWASDILQLIVRLGSATTATATAVCFWPRLAHSLIHTAAVKVIRTVVFLGGFVCQLVLALCSPGAA